MRPCATCKHFRDWALQASCSNPRLKQDWGPFKPPADFGCNLHEISPGKEGKHESTSPGKEGED